MSGLPNEGGGHPPAWTCPPPRGARGAPLTTGINRFLPLMMFARARSGIAAIDQGAVNICPARWFRATRLRAGLQPPLALEIAS
jgi:hypothetical protein